MNSFEIKVKEIIESKSVLGVVVGIINQNKVETLALGTTDGIIPCDLNTRYDLASITKIFVTTRIFQLIDENILILDTKIKDIIPEFQDDSISISNLLLHNSGMMPSVRTRYELQGEKLKSYIYSMNDYLKEQKGKTVYSCINFVLLGEVIERVDQKLDQSIEEHIFKPLGMNETSFNGSQAAPTQLLESGEIIQGRVHDQTSFALNGLSGNAGIFTTMNDMLLFAQGLLNKTIISQKTIDLMINTNIGNRSYGWNRFNKDHLYHTGSTGPLLFIDFKSKQSLIVLTNRTFPVLDNQVYLRQRDELFKLYLDNISK